VRQVPTGALCAAVLERRSRALFDSEAAAEKPCPSPGPCDTLVQIYKWGGSDVEVGSLAMALADLLASCSDRSTSPEKPPGIGCWPRDGNGTCNAGLTCGSNLGEFLLGGPW